jgi:hypothetical protein
MQLASPREAFPKIKSSAKSKWWMGEVFLAILSPLIWRRLSSLNIILENTFEPRINKKGERGSPYLKPLAGENKPKGLPLIKIEKEEEVIQDSIHPIQVTSYPNIFRIASRKDQSILSKAFSISIFRNIKLIFLFCS